MDRCYESESEERINSIINISLAVQAHWSLPLSSVAFAYADSVSMASYRFLPSASGRGPAASARRAARPSLPVAASRTGHGVRSVSQP